MITKNKPATSAAKMRSYRARLRKQGLRPIQIWVPDCNAPGFAELVRKQVASLNPADEKDILDFMESVEYPLDDESW